MLPMGLGGGVTTERCSKVVLTAESWGRSGSIDLGYDIAHESVAPRFIARVEKAHSFERQ